MSDVAVPKIDSRKKIKEAFPTKSPAPQTLTALRLGEASGLGSHLTRALTVERTTLDSRNSGVTRMWKSEREAKATAGDRSASSEM